MDKTTLFDGYRIVLSEESRTRLQLFEKWLPDVATRTVETRREFWTAFDDRTIVACLSRPLFGAEESRIRKAILSRNPHCRLVALLPHGANVPSMTGAYDAYLRRPVYRRDLQETVETQLKYGVYSHTLQEFYTVNAELSGFGHKGPKAGHDGKWQRDLARYRGLKTRLDHLQANMDSTDLDAIVRSLKLHNQQLTEPSTETEVTRGSKYHPVRCPHCKLPWGVDHRNALGIGLERVGAYVWKCTRCAELTHGLGTSHRRVFR